MSNPSLRLVLLLTVLVAAVAITQLNATSVGRRSKNEGPKQPGRGNETRRAEDHTRDPSSSASQDDDDKGRTRDPLVTGDRENHTRDPLVTGVPKGRPGRPGRPERPQPGRRSRQ